MRDTAEQAKRRSRPYAPAPMIDMRARVGASPYWVVVTIAVLVWILAASNGRPASSSSGLFVLLIAPVLLIARGPAMLLDHAFRRGTTGITFAFIAFGLTSLVSALAVSTFETFEAWLVRCLLPFLVFLTLLGLRLTRSDVRLLMMAIVLGSGLLFARGTVAYLSEFGWPDGNTLMWARFDRIRIAGYSDATLGNVTHMGSYLALTIPVIVIFLFSWAERLWERLLAGLTLILAFANLLFCGSRTGMAVLLFALVLIMVSYGVRRLFISGILIVSLFAVTMPAWIELVVDPEFIKRYLPSVGEAGFDASAVERYESVVIGWDVFLQNPILGVGPGMSHFFNFYSIPHQSFVHALSELGLIGGLTFVWMSLYAMGLALRAMLPSAAASGQGMAAYRFAWLIGPGCWYFMAAVSGIIFTMGIALSWSGIAAAMLALSRATIVGPESEHQRISRLQPIDGGALRAEPRPRQAL